MRARATHDEQRDRQAQRGRLGRGQRRRAARRPPGAGLRGRTRRRSRERLLAMELESPRPRRSTSTSPSSREGARDRRGTDHGKEMRSPSVQLRVLPGGAVELLSTHDQLLGGASGQSYLGCAFPAAPQYARSITRAGGRRSAHRLAREGALGTVRRRLRRGARTTTASGRRTRSSSTCAKAGPPIRSSPCSSSPTAGTTPSTALFMTPRGREKHLVATDHLESDLLRGSGADRPLRHRRPERAALRPGTAVGRRVPHDQLPHRARSRRPDRGRRQPRRGAHQRYREAERILLEEARLSLQERPLPV